MTEHPIPEDLVDNILQAWREMEGEDDLTEHAKVAVIFASERIAALEAQVDECEKEIDHWKVQAHSYKPAWDQMKSENLTLEAENAQLKAQVAAPNNFREWWTEDGRFLDPDTEDVPWFYKREALAEYAFDAGIRSLDRLITKLRDERNVAEAQVATAYDTRDI